MVGYVEMIITLNDRDFCIYILFLKLFSLTMRMHCNEFLDLRCIENETPANKFRVVCLCVDYSLQCQ